VTEFVRGVVWPGAAAASPPIDNSLGALDALASAQRNATRGCRVRLKLAGRKLISIVVDNVTKSRQHHGVVSTIPSSDSGHSGGGLIIVLLRSKAIISRKTERV
jgi:hypothetical protein